MRLSTDTMAEFQEHLLASEESLPISFSTMVLQSAAWPLQRSTCTVHIPPQLASAIEKVGGWVGGSVGRVGVGVTYGVGEVWIGGCGLQCG
jgi:hypothetical protein